MNKTHLIFTLRGRRSFTRVKRQEQGREGFVFLFFFLRHVAGNACTEMKEIGAREGTKVERAMGDKLGFLQIFEFGETSIKFQFFFY
jgi:hypothetical protein